VSSDRQTVTFTPSSALAVSTSYTVTLGSFADVAGNLVAPFTSSFTTGTSAVADTTGPTVVAVTPANGSTLTDNSTPVVITFSEVINPVTVTNILVRDLSNNASNIAGAWSVSGVQATFTPASPYPANSQIQVLTQDLVRDLAGNPDTAYVVTTFTTAAVADTTPPTVISVTPSNGATGVGLNAQPVVTFSKSLDPATVNNNNFALFANGSRIGNVNGISADNRTVTMYGGLPASTVVTVVVTSAVQDLSGNHLADFTSQFTTMSALDAGHASVVGERPGNGANGVAVSSSIVLFINEPLNPSTVNGALHISQNGAVVSGTVQVTGNGQTIQFQPASALASNALVQVFLDATALDVDGNSVNSYQASFRTATDPLTTPPVEVAVNPVYGTSNVPLNPVIAIQYNEGLDPNTVNATNVTMTGPNGVGNTKVLVSLDATGTVILITPVDGNNNRINLQPGVYYYSGTTTGIHSASGVAQQNNASWYFYTGTASDTTNPTVLTVTPPDGVTNVGDNASIVVRFSKPVDPLTYAAVAFLVAVAALLSCYVPALRALRVDPVAALRQE